MRFVEKCQRVVTPRQDRRYIISIGLVFGPIYHAYCPVSARFQHVFARLFTIKNEQVIALLALMKHMFPASRAAGGNRYCPHRSSPLLTGDYRAAVGTESD